MLVRAGYQTESRFSDTVDCVHPDTPVMHFYLMSKSDALAPEHLITLIPEHLHAPPGGSGEEARAQVSGGVQRVTAVQPHGDADAQQDQTHGQWLHASRSTHVPAVHNRQNTEDQHPRPHHLMTDGDQLSELP